MEGAALTFGASMPSMPLAHSVPRAAARPSGKTGEYAVSLELKMNGIWALEVDLSAPGRERIVRVVRAEMRENRPLPRARRPTRGQQQSQARRAQRCQSRRPALVLHQN